MMYHGKLYGKLWNKYFETGKTSEDFDKMEERLKELESENLALKKANDVQAKEATAILPHVRCFKTYGENIIKELGFELDHKYDHDQFHTNRYRKGLLMVEFTYEDKKLQTVDLTIDETFCKPITYAELKALSPILGEIPE